MSVDWLITDGMTASGQVIPGCRAGVAETTDRGGFGMQAVKTRRPAPRVADRSRGTTRILSDIEIVLSRIPRCRRAFIGDSYFFIRSDSGRETLFRMIIAGGSMYFSEAVSHEGYGITDEDMGDAIREDTGELEVPGYFPISVQIERKLRSFLEP